MPRFRNQRQIDHFVHEHGRKALDELVITNNLDESSFLVFQEWLSPNDRWKRLGTYAAAAGACIVLVGCAVWAAAMTMPLPPSQPSGTARAAVARLPVASACDAGFMLVKGSGTPRCEPLKPARDFDF